MIPITGVIIALSKDIISFIFMRGAFGESSLQMTNMALVLYSIGLIFYSLNRQIIPIFYARKNTKTPVKISAVIVALNIVLNIILMQWLQHGGLALATSLSALAHFFILKHYLKKLYPEMKLPYILPEILKIIIITALIYILLIWLQTLFSPIGIWQTALRLIILLTISALILLPARKLIRFKKS